MRRMDAVERRARLALRHSVVAGHRAGDVVEAARSMICLHGTDPVTVYLSARARVDGMTVSDLERALYVDRSLVKHLAMRRTLFVFPRAALPLAQAGASNRVADSERRRLIRDVEAAGLHRNGALWLSTASEQVLELLSDGREFTSSQVRDAVPALEGSIAYGEGRPWGGRVPVGPRVMTTLSAAGRVLRASNDGGWTTSRPRWASTRSWYHDGLVRTHLVPRPVQGAVVRYHRQCRIHGVVGRRIVGGWRQSDTGEVVLQLLEDIGSHAQQVIEGEAARLTEWLGGIRVLPRFPSPLWKT